MLKFSTKTKKVVGKSVQPSVIEPSYGLGRILYAALEQSFWKRENDEQRCVLSLAPILAPYKCSILPLKNNEELNLYIDKIGAFIF